MKERATQLLRDSLNDESADFRDGQWDAIQGVLDNKKQLVVQRTGWGKSIVYFIAARLLRDQGKGPVIIVSPLLALIRNQIDAASRVGLRAESIDSNNKKEWPAIQRKVVLNEVDLILVTPQRLPNEWFRKYVQGAIADRVSLFVVDEAHCISDWGHDFMPDYRYIARILVGLPSNLPVLATTATANSRVVADVKAQLGDDLIVIRGPLTRHSLSLQNVCLPSSVDRYAWIVSLLKAIKGSGIIYALTVRDVERLAEWLQKNGVSAHAYSGQSDDAERPRLEKKLINNEVKALVATTALSMGFDKPDLKFVIHFQRPSSVVHYYQQVGRAGRAVDNAFGILMGGLEDDRIADYFIRTSFPPQAHVDRVLKKLCDSNMHLGLSELEKQINLSQSQIKETLKFLEYEHPAPVVKSDKKWSANAYARDYKIDQERIEAMCELRRDEQTQMQAYMGHNGCLMRFLVEALDDPQADDCGKCASCRNEDIFSLKLDPLLQREAADFLRRTYRLVRPRKQKPKGRFHVFEELGYRLDLGEKYCCREGRALCAWGDPVWGEMVRNGKYPVNDGACHFSQELVDACFDMIADWEPDTKPAWVTAIPSLRHPDLVPNFAKRLADRLDLPYHEALIKTADCERQRKMNNSGFQVRNLDGTLKVKGELLPKGPVLLFDDIVNSRWTFTVAGYLLQKSGIEAVLPVALADSSQSYS